MDVSNVDTKAKDETEMKYYLGSFLLIPPIFNSPHTIMDLQNNKRRNVLIHARVNFSQSETSLLLLGGGGELNFELLL